MADRDANAKPTPLVRMWRATINTSHGIAFAFRSEQAFREEVAALVLAVPAAWVVGVTAMRRLELIGVVLLLMAVELLNTAIEKLSDRLTTDHDPQIRHVKDMGSAAVGVMIVVAGLAWLFAIAERMGLI